MNTTELVSAVPTLTDAELSELEGAIHQARTARVAARNESLPEFPWVVGVQGHAVPVQVTREAAITLLAAGTHQMYTPEAG
jgi:hypothetical protein